MKNKTIKFFYQISKIPRESGNEKEISNYICDFAKERNLEYFQDKYGNVIIKKKNSNSTPVILQAHLDMVCEKNREFNFEKQGIEIYEENGYLKANGTTLGADNGIGVAQILNILDSDIKANIEAIFTVQEETTMIGAENITVSNLSGNKMINLDGFSDHTITIESASFFDIIYKMNFNFNKNNKFKKIYKINLTGLQGGHSGFDINKNRGNSSIILAKLLKKFENIEIAEFIGGTKFNVIPSAAESIFSSNLKKEKLEKIICNYINIEKNNYKKINIELEEINIEKDFLNNNDSEKFLNSILEFKNGVINENEKKEVTTSVNLGVVDLRNMIMKIGMRSSRKDEENNCIENLKKYAKINNYEFKILSSQPGFFTSEEDNLVKELINIHEKIFKNKKLNVKSVHVTVEAGFFKEKIKDLQIAIISPKIIGAHTVNECVEIESILECDMWLKEYLENSK